MKIEKNIKLITTLFFISILFQEYCFANEFAIDLFKQESKSDKNCIISPIGTTYAFALAFIGAKGKTYDEIAQVFGFSKNENQFNSTIADQLKTFKQISNSGNVELLIAASLWPNNKYLLDKTFSERAKKIFNSGVQSLNFSNSSEACGLINNWASKKTKGKFNSIISPSNISYNTQILMTSAVYFKGKWEDPFSKQSTKERMFYRSRTDSFKVPTMYEEQHCRYLQTHDLQAIEMQYTGREISMFIVLPRNTDGLSIIEKSITHDSITKWTNNLNRRKVKVYLPRFKFTTQSNILQSLKVLGVNSVFNPMTADFSGLCTQENSLFINNVMQKANIEVNEEGTEATSIDAMIGNIIGLSSSPPPPVPIFRANHPFLFIIKENSSGKILFIGKLNDPLEN